MSQCHWCGAPIPAGADVSCPRCGAPVGTQADSGAEGWLEAPRLRDLTTFAFGSGSHATMIGGIVPVLEIVLTGSDSAVVEAGALLWKQAECRVRARRVQGGMRRAAAQMPHVLVEMLAPGSFGISRDDAGEMVVLPMAAGDCIHARERSFLAVTGDISYDYVHVSGLKTLSAGGRGFYFEQFSATGDGVLVVHGCGDVLERRLQPGEEVLVEMGGVLYCDATVGIVAETLSVREGPFHARAPMVRASGPGRLGVQTMTPSALR